MEGQWNWTALPGDDEAVVAEGEVSEGGGGNTYGVFAGQVGEDGGEELEAIYDGSRRVIGVGID